MGEGVCVDTPSMPCDTPSYNTPSSSGGSRSSSGAAGSADSGPTARQQAALQHQQIMNNMMLNTMQGLMGNFMEGFRKGLEQNRQLQEQRQQELMIRARAEMERERQRALAAQRAMERNRLQFQAAKQRLAGVARSMGATEASPRPILRVGEETGAFGTKVLKPRSTGALVPMDDREKVACGQDLLFEAGGAAVDGSHGGLVASLKEAAFLSRQANQAVSGGQLDVACPTSSSDQLSQADNNLGLLHEAIQQQSEIFSALYDRVADNMQRMIDSRNLVKETEEKLSETQAIRDETARTVEMLQAEMSPSQNVPPGGTEVSSPVIDQDGLATKQSALAEAMAALAESEQALNDIQQVYTQNKSTMAEMEESLKSVESLMQKVLTDPEGVTELRTELGLPSLPKNHNPG